MRCAYAGKCWLTKGHHQKICALISKGGAAVNDGIFWCNGAIPFFLVIALCCSDLHRDPYILLGQEAMWASSDWRPALLMAKKKGEIRREMGVVNYHWRWRSHHMGENDRFPSRMKEAFTADDSLRNGTFLQWPFVHPASSVRSIQKDWPGVDGQIKSRRQRPIGPGR